MAFASKLRELHEHARGSGARGAEDVVTVRQEGRRGPDGEHLFTVRIAGDGPAQTGVFERSA